MFCNVLLEKMLINKNLGVYSVADYMFRAIITVLRDFKTSTDKMQNYFSTWKEIGKYLKITEPGTFSNKFWHFSNLKNIYAVLG